MTEPAMRGLREKYCDDPFFMDAQKRYNDAMKEMIEIINNQGHIVHHPDDKRKLCFLKI